MTNEQRQRKRLEESIEVRTLFLASQVSAGDRIAAFIDLSEQIKTDPILAREFAALREEHRQLEELNGMTVIKVTKENYGHIRCSQCGRAVEVGLSGDLCERCFTMLCLSEEDAEAVRNSPSFSSEFYEGNDEDAPDPADYDENWFNETKTRAYRRAVLTALAEVGGSAPFQSILPRVEQIMRPHLTERDYEPVQSYPDQLLWDNRARRTRQELVAAGLMKNDSPEGIWEISEVGRTALLHGDY